MQWIHTVIISHAISLGLVLVLFVGVLRKKNKTVIHWIFGGLLLGGLIWPATNSISEYMTLRAAPLDWVGSVAGIAIQFTALSVYALCEFLPLGRGTKYTRLRVIVIGLITLALCPFIFSPDWISERRAVDGVTRATYGHWYYVLSLWAVFTILLGLFLLYGKFRKEKEKRLRIHMGLFLIGVLASLLTAFVFAFLLPLLGRHALFFLGVDSIIVFVALVTYPILFHRMFDLRTAVLRMGLRFVLSIAVSSVIYILFLLLLVDQGLSSFSWKLALMLSLFFLSAVVFARMILPALDRLLFHRRHRAEDTIVRLFRNMDESRDLDHTLAATLDTLSRAIPFKKAVFIAADFENRFTIHMRDCEIKFEPEAIQLFRRMLRRERLPRSFFADFDRTIVLEKWTRFIRSGTSSRYRRILALITRVLNGLSADGFRVFMPLLHDRNLRGFIVLGEKKDDFPYYSPDRNLLDAVRLSMGVLLQHKRNLDRMNLIKEEARSDLVKLTDLISSRKRRERTVRDRTIVYQSAAMHQVVNELEKIAANNRPVLVTGETGTGKEIVARLIHEQSDAREQPFVAVNCATLSETLWEDELFGHVKGAFTDAKGDRVGRVREAGAGVLFLDEVGETPLEMQAKLLRLLQERKYSPVGSDSQLDVNCRFIFATNRSLNEMIRSGKFREDLYYRINVFNPHLPSLRERQEDIPLLLEHFLERACNEMELPAKKFEPAALNVLMRYAWPGNIRELENFVVRTAALVESETVTIADLPLEIRNAPRAAPRVVLTHNDIPDTDRNLRDMVDDYTRRILVETLKKTRGNRTKAAELLGIKRGSLLYRMKELNVE